MQTIEEFMQSYFAERAELYRAHRVAWDAFQEIFFTADYLIILRDSWDEDWAYERENPAVVLSIRIRKKTTVAITSEPELREHVHYRYYLRITEGCWQIDRKGKKCSFCDGTGYQRALLAMKQVDGMDGCSFCKGLGWVYDESSHT